MPIGNTVYLFTRKQMGDDNELGRKLIRGFLTNLAKQEVLPKLLYKNAADLFNIQLPQE